MLRNDSTMHIHLSPRHLTLTAAIHAYVAEKISHIEHISSDIIAAHVVLLHDETKTKRYTVSVHLAVAGPDIYVETISEDLYTAIDSVVLKLARQLRKRKTRFTSSGKRRSQRDTEEKKRGYARR